MKALTISPYYDPSCARHAHDIAIMVTNRLDGSVERFALMQRGAVVSWLTEHSYDSAKFAILICGISILGEYVQGLDAEVEIDSMPNIPTTPTSKLPN